MSDRQPVKPVLLEGDYQISFYDADDDLITVVKGSSLTESIEIGDELLRSREGYVSYRVDRCIVNSKYNRWFAGQR